MRHNTGIHLALCSVILMWGGVFVAVAKLLPSMDALQLVTIRFVLTSVAFGLIFLATPSLRPRLTRQQLGVLVVAGALAVPGAQLPVVQGQNYLSPALVSVFVTLSPAWAAVISAIWLKERFTYWQIFGFVVAFAGSVVVIVTGTGDGDLTVDNPWGASLALLTPVCWGTYTVMSKPLSTKYPPLTSVGVAVIAGTLLMAPLYPHSVGVLGDLTASDWMWLLYLLFGGTLITYWIWYKALARMPASKTAAYMYGVPFAALLWSWLLLDTVPTGLALAGGAVMIAGVILTQWSGPTSQPEPELREQAATEP
ncbi:MAG: DMT family transporter [Acidimicrobiales bacterium]